MKVLFSPSESKSELETFHENINKNSFCCTELYNVREKVINEYKATIKSADYKLLHKIFGIKDKNKCTELAQKDITKIFTCKAIQRYNGVGYKYLDYDTLSKERKKFIDNNVLIFSNLFGPILAKDKIPYYKLKQGFKFENLKIEEFYNINFSDILDEFLKDELVIDLRAGFYEKFYKIKEPHITIKFFKNGKVISHWAKAYRGKMLRELSLHQPLTKDDFEKINFENLKILQICEKSKKSEYIFEILE